MQIVKDDIGGNMYNFIRLILQLIAYILLHVNYIQSFLIVFNSNFRIK